VSILAYILGFSICIVIGSLDLFNGINRYNKVSDSSFFRVSDMPSWFC
jgi:hypothetical protein